MVKFEFKRTNQEATPHYRPPARSDQALGLPLARASMSLRRGDSARGAGGSAPRAGAIAPH
jgi:hypothetical protein